jgi:hypothetical protein
VTAGETAISIIFPVAAMLNTAICTLYG